MKPSTGRIPQYPVDALESSTVGPLARSTADIALIMNIISKPDVRDGTSLPYDNVDYTLYKEVLLPRKKIACIKFGEDADIKPMHKIIDHLTSMGNQIDFISLDVESGMKIFSKLSDTKILHRWLNIPNDLRTLTGRHTQRRAILALAHEKEDTYSQLINRHDLITSMREIMQSYDVLLGSVTTWQSDRQIDPAEIVSPLSSFFCMTRQPTITVPIGVDSNGTPMSVMIAGGMYNDTQVLQVASAIEKQFPMPLCPVIL
jgi:aspartyl-tRNA(Asn)/glutamyl-tRNA(Gln) amidotransferase subunit A